MTSKRVVRRAGKTLRIWLAASAAMAALPVAAGAQQAQAPAGGGQIGPPQLRDFQLEPRQRIVTQPRPAPQPQPTEAQPTPARERQAETPAQRTTEQPTARQTPRSIAEAPRAPLPRAPVAGGPAPARAPDTEAALPPGSTTLPDAPQLQVPSETPAAAPSQAPAANGAPAPAAPTEPGGLPLWLILLAGLGLGLGGYLLLTRRRATQRRALAGSGEAVAATPQPQAPRVPRPDPVPRPWLEIELTPERTTADPEESVVEFELRIRNKGGSTATDIRLQAKLFCSTPDQDKQIGEFHRKKPGEHRTLSIPDIPAGQELALKGSVDIKRDQIKLLRVEGRLLFIPLIAVNAFYGWGSGRSGQTSKSFLVGRETAEAADKMAPFRMDLGPRVYRTVGQRPYAVERRV